jgi:LacI family transcriptional regulator
MATIHDVAKAAGVSITTVSRALNGHSDVNEKTRQRITRLAKELGYHPNTAARNLRDKRTNTIAFAPRLPARSDSRLFYREFIGLLTFDCFQHNLSLLVTLPYPTQNEVEMYKELVGTERVDAIIVASIQPEDPRIPLLRKSGIPFLAFGRQLDETDLSYPFVDVDGRTGMRQLVNYLLAQGHRRIAYLSDFQQSSFIYYRQMGYQEALRAHAIEEDPELSIIGLLSQSDTTQALTRMFALPVERAPTAVVTSNNQIALYVLAALRTLGRSAGKGADQIAVASFDDLSFAAYIDPPLTTVRQPLEEVSKLLLALLVSIIKQEELDISQAAYPHLRQLGPQQFLLMPELVIRDSA